MQFLPNPKLGQNLNLNYKLIAKPKRRLTIRFSIEGENGKWIETLY